MLSVIGTRKQVCSFGIFAEYPPAVIYSHLYASIHRLYLSSVDYSSHYLSDIFFCMRFSRYVFFVTACFISHLKPKSLLILNHWSNQLSQQHFPADRVNVSFLLGMVLIPCPSGYICIYMNRISSVFSFLIWQPPALPHRLQCSTIGRLGLNLRVRDGNGCVP